MQTKPGKAYPLGANVDDEGVNFSLFSAHATAVTLCLFAEDGQQLVAEIPMEDQTHQVWHIHVQGLKDGQLYAYRVDGPYQPSAGHRFNKHKLLLDPYARQLVGAYQFDASHFGYQNEGEIDDSVLNEADNSPFIPRCKVVDIRPLMAQTRPAKPDIPLRKWIIYETHLRGLTMQHADIPEDIRGTFAALGTDCMINYLVELGINCVELLPVHAFFDESFLHDKGLNNYWGYNSIGFFAPHTPYMHRDDIRECREVIDKLHEAGIMVMLDVVYNHTAEGNQLGPTYSYRGIDNLSYYRLHPNDKRYYINDTGCGNMMNLTHPRVLQMVMDSLRYWVEVIGVDGFRFDLASCLGREDYGFDPRSGFFDAIMQDPVLCQVKLIAEPWDIGPGGYQLGNFPVNWSEWNDKYRDTVRRFWRGDSGMLAEFARRFHGSGDIFEHAGRRPASSINFVTSHDGFTLRDLVSYNQRHNEPNGEDNKDGHSENYSYNHGVEGPTDDPKVRALRFRQLRNIMTTLMLSQGVPMLLAGDENGHIQNGNNNAYCQDNPIGWRDWVLDDYQHELHAFTQHLIKIRKQFPMLCSHSYIHKPEKPTDPGLLWFNRHGDPMSKSDWSGPHTRSLVVSLMGDIEENGGRKALLLLLNADHQAKTFVLPKLEKNTHWHCLLHTQDNTNLEKPMPVYSTLLVQDRSLVLLTADISGEAK